MLACVEAGLPMQTGQVVKRAVMAAVWALTLEVLGSILVHFHKVADKYFAFSFRSDGVPYPSLKSLAQPLISLRFSFGQSAFRSLVCIVCLKLWHVGL